MAKQQLRLIYGPAPSQFADLYLPAAAGPHPLVILLHGGYWRARYGLDLMTPLAADLVAHGYAAWNIEYRRVGEPGGGWPGTFTDVAAAVEWLRASPYAQQLDWSCCVAIGHSAGGHLALWLAARHRLAPGTLGAANAVLTGPTALRLAGVISQAGVNNLQTAYQRGLSNNAVVELLGGTPNEVPDRYAAADPSQLLPLGLPQVLVHSPADDLVPLALSEDYARAAAAAGDPAHFRQLTGDHFTLIDPTTPDWAVILEELHWFIAERHQWQDGDAPVGAANAIACLPTDVR